MTDTFTNDPAQTLTSSDPSATAAVPKATPQAEANYFDRYDAESDASEPGLMERARLNAKHSYYRGTLAGASDLTGMAHVYQMDDTNATPEQKDYRKTVRDKYDNVVGDLARYDTIRPWGTTTEGAAAFAGQIAGGAASPENLIGWGSQGANLAIRTAKAAVQQGFITGTIDPIVQYLNIGAGVQKEYDPTQTAMAFGVGAIIGGGLHIGGELVSSAHIKKTTAELGKDDPQFRAPGDVVEPAPVEPVREAAAIPQELSAIPATPTPRTPEQQALIDRRNAIEAYHGTPHDFEAFDTSKIDTGEGAQAYGHGLYFAENKGVAEGYRSKLADGNVIPTDLLAEYFKPGEIINSYGGGRDKVVAFDKETGTVKVRSVDANGNPTNDMLGLRDRTHQTMPDLKELNAAFRRRGLPEYTPGALYQVRITADKDAMLDWDKPFSQQSEAARASMRKVAEDLVARDGDDKFDVMHAITADEDANTFYERLADALKTMKKGAPDTNGLYKIDMGHAAASETLSEAGIPGIKYLDQSSRGAGEGTRNFVVFNDKHVEITSKNGKPVSSQARAEELALAQRVKGGTLPMEKQRAPAGVSGDADGLTGTAVATVPKSPQQDAAIKSLQQQSVALAEALDIPLRQGRIKNKNALGTFNTGSGVVRVREVPDFEAVAHEAGHAIEYKVGKELTDLTNKYGTELAPMVSNAAAYDPSMHVKEGFAEFIRRYIGNPAHAEQVAPGFTLAFRDFMGKKAPDILKAIDEASAGYRAYIEAPSVDAVGAVVRSRSEEAHGWKKVVEDIKTDGFAATVKTVVQNVYRGLLDDKAPVALAVRDLAKAALDYLPEGSLIDLKAADNPEVLMRLFARSHQSAVRDMMDGVRGYHSIEPAGPSLSDALAHASGSPTVWGKWDPDKKALFSDFMVARRASLLWDKFKAGDLANPPVAFSKADAVVAMAELEKANPRFREASNMVHQWTRELLRKQYEGGLIPADLFDRLSKEEFYVPFMRDLSDKPNAGGGGKSGSSDGPGMTDTVKRMKGSSRDIKDPIESLMTQAFLVNRTLAHNDIIKAFVKLSEQAGTEGGKFVEKIPAHEGRGYNFDMAQSIERLAKERGINADDAKVLTSALTDMFGEDPIVGSFFRMEPAGKRGEPIVFYKEAGQMKAARFMSGEEGHALYETLTALPAPLTDAWSQLIAATTSTLRAGITTNPMFALTNYIRDQFAVAILRSDYVPIVSGLKGLHQEVTQGQSAVLYGYGGGVSGGASIAPLEKAIENDVNALAKKGYLVNRLTSFKGVMELAGITEAGTRNSVFGKVFEAKKAQGLNDYEAMIEAAFSAQDVLDFSRHGSHTLMIRKYIPFINAWAQGLDKAKRTMFDPIINKVSGDQVFASDPKDFNNAMLSVTKLFGVGGVLGAGWAALNAEKEGYRDASPQIKGTHVVIPIGNRILLVPKPFELGIGFTAGEYAYQGLMQQDPRAAGQFASAAWDSMTSGNPLTDIPLVKQYFELKSGKSLFTGKDIVPGALQRLAPEMQYTNSTSSMAKWLGEKIGVSPIKVDYAVGSTFGLWGKDIMALSSGVDPDAPAQSWEDRVFVRRLLKDPARTSDVTTKFWEYMGKDTGKYNQNVNTYDDMIKKFRDDDAKAFADKLPDAQRAFLIMKSASDEDGKPAFKPDEKRLHPLQRAYDAVTILNGLRRELTENTFKTYETGTQQKLDPQSRRDLIDNVRELAQMEMRNALVILKEPGYANRPIFNVNDTMDKIMAVDPMIGNEIATRYATAKIYKTDAVARTFPALQSELLRNGSEADIANLADDASADGYQFDGDRVKKPQKRRVKSEARTQQ